MSFFNRLFGKGETSKSADFRALIDQSVAELRLKTQVHDGAWGLAESTWSVDQELGNIVFKNRDGVTAVCPVQIIGTFNIEDNTWLWAWDHPSVQPALQEHAKRVRKYGETNGVTKLTTRKLPLSEDEAWEFAALACKLCDAQGAYRGPSGSAMVFMTFGEVQLSRPVAGHRADGPEPRSIHSSRLPDASSDIPEDVRKTVQSFVKALYQWEAEAYANQKEGEQTTEAAKQKYTVLIREWCDESVTPQPISYGSDPNHHPERETILDAQTEGDRCIVTTKHVGAHGFESMYEYHLIRKDGRWRITSLLYTDEDGKYECL